MDNIKNILKRLKQPIVLLTTLINIYALLENVDVLNFCGITEQQYMKIVWIIIALGVQLGILNKPVDEKIIEKIEERNY